MRERRATEFHYFDWDFNRWFGSETRARCRAIDSTGLPGGLMGAAACGIYRELLDYCAKDGSIPADLGGLAALAGVSPEVIDAVWPVLKNKFSPHKKLPNRLVNFEVDARRNFWRRKQQQASLAGLQSAKKRTSRKANDDNNFCANDRSIPLQRNVNDPSIPFNHEVGNRKEEIGKSIPPTPSSPSDQSFGELWEAYPPKGRTKLVDAQRWYLEAVAPDPERIHAAILAAVLPGGKWAESDAWARGFVPGISEWIRNRRWLEEPEPYDPHKSERNSNGRKSGPEWLERERRIAAGEVVA